MKWFQKILTFVLPVLLLPVCSGCAGMSSALKHPRKDQTPSDNAAVTNDTVPAREINPRIDEARKRLRTIGMDVSDEQAMIVAENEEKILEFSDLSVEDTVLDLLNYVGCGNYNYDTGEWTPLSEKLYAFDAEVFDVAHMYTLFLQGMQAIVEDVVISDVTEDFSELSDEENFDEFIFGGTRSISFSVNGHPYSIELEDQGDWFNSEMLERFAVILEKEYCSGKLYLLSAEGQVILLYYGSEEEATALYSLIN